MPQSNALFAERLTEGIRQIRFQESKTISAIQDELGYALGKKGGASIEHWRKGHTPARLTDVETLGREIVRRGHMDSDWLAAFLQSAGHPAPERLCEVIFPANARRESSDDAGQANLDAFPTIAALPPFLTTRPSPNDTETHFVGRERELHQLKNMLALAISGQGQVVFVTGEAGNGKTTLVQKFVAESQASHPDLIVAGGNCFAYTGVGDPYFPFREILGLLTGDVEAKLAIGSVSYDHALRLWRLMPDSVQTLVDRGPDLIGALLSAEGLISRAQFQPGGREPGWLAQVRALQDRQGIYGDQGADQRHIFQAFTDMLVSLAAQQPLLFFLDDLHWADVSSISLLFHFCRHIDRSRILIVGTYRPEEIALTRNGERHPLAEVLPEFKRIYGDVWIGLGQGTEARQFVKAIVAREPNRLSQDFHEALFHHTQGHALFTIELLRDMQERGDLRRDEAGCWVEGAGLDWGVLPAKVEGVIEKRIGRLGDELQALLAVASVEGQHFSAQVVSGVTGVPEWTVLRQLSHQLEKQHFLVREQAELTVAGRRLTCYRFAHVLYQQYIYQRLSSGERRLLHRKVATALEDLYDEAADAIAVQLAHHFNQAEAWPHAFCYLLTSGHKARAAHATQEAITSYTGAISASRLIAPPLSDRILLPAYEGRALVYMLLTEHVNAIADFQVVCRLARSCGDQQKEGEALCHLAFAHWSMFAEEHAPFAEQCGQKAFALAQQIGDQRILAKSLTSLGIMHQWRGNLQEATRRLETSVQISRREGYRASVGQNLLWMSAQANWQGDFHRAVELGEECLVIMRGIHDGLQELFCMAFLGLAAGGSGNYGYAFSLFNEGTVKAKERENPFFIGRFMNQLGWIHSEYGDFARSLDQNLESVEFGCVSGTSNVEVSALINVGLDYLALGRTTEARSYLEPTLERVEREAFGSHRWRWTERLLIGLAELSYRENAFEQALDYAEAGLKVAHATTTRKYIAKGQALQGKILLALNQPAGGAMLRQASDLASRLCSPALIYPLALELGQWQAGTGQHAEAIVSFRRAQAAIDSMALTIEDSELQSAFRQSTAVQAVRDGPADLS